MIMPIYEYECTSCNHTFDAVQNINDAPINSCPQCGKKVRRLINGGLGVIFKGSGFYVNDKKSGTASGPSREPHKAAEACSGCAAAESCPKAANS